MSLRKGLIFDNMLGGEVRICFCCVKRGWWIVFAHSKGRWIFNKTSPTPPLPILNGHFLICHGKLKHQCWPHFLVHRTATYARGGYFHTWHGSEVPQWWPTFLKVPIQASPYFIPHHNLIDPHLSAEKIQFVSITFSSIDTWI